MLRLSPLCLLLCVGLYLGNVDTFAGGSGSSGTREQLGRKTDLTDAQKQDYLRTGPYCGAISTYLACRYYGRETTLEDLVRDCGELEEEGASLALLVSVLRKRGISAEPVRMTPDDLVNARVPLITIVRPEWGDKSHFVFVPEVRADSVYVIDTTIFAGRVPLSAFLDAWQGTGIAVLGPMNSGTEKIRNVLILLILVEVLIIAVLSLSRRSVGLITLILGLMMFAWFGHSNASATVETSPIQSDQNRKEFGKCTKGDILSHTFTLTNAALDKCALSVQKKTCTCVAADLGKDLLDPNESTTLEVKVDTKGQSAGQHSAFVVVNAARDNIGSGTELFLIKYTVGEPFSLTPRSLALGGIETASSTVRFIRIGFDSDYNINSLNVVSSAPWIEAVTVTSSFQPKPIDEAFFSREADNKEIYLQVDMLPGSDKDPGTEFKESVNVTVGGDVIFRETIPISGHFVGRTRLIPRTISLFRSNREGRMSTRVSAKNAEMVAIKSFLPAEKPEYLQCLVDTVVEGSSYSISITAGEPPVSGVVKGILSFTVEYEDSYVERLVLPFTLLSM